VKPGVTNDLPNEGGRTRNACRVGEFLTLERGSDLRQSDRRRTIAVVVVASLTTSVLHFRRQGPD